MTYSRSRQGSPAAPNSNAAAQMQMQAMRTVSPVTSSPLSNMMNNGMVMSSSANVGLNGVGQLPMPMPMQMQMSGGYGYRPTIGMGMGGLGMLLINKRNANGQAVGTGLMGNDGELAVAEGIGGMDVTSADNDEDEDKMVFD